VQRPVRSLDVVLLAAISPYYLVEPVKQEDIFPILVLRATDLIDRLAVFPASLLLWPTRLFSPGRKWPENTAGFALEKAAN
jgi:hypothetical protein